MSKGRLTRQELGWLLTQEAQGAAERLRRGVQILKTKPPPPPSELPPLIQERDESSSPPPSQSGGLGVEASLEALDDVMRMLSSLHTKPAQGRGRRGRLDLASLLWEVAPEARVQIEPGSGTEVYGDEGEIRRMLHVMLGHGSGLGSSVTIRRDGDEVRLSVALGPDSTATADTERAWLSRMAVRYGGRYELEGGNETLSLPAGDATARDERDALRKELDEARKQGEAYARELAAVFAQGEELAAVSQSSFPPPTAMEPSAERFGVLARLAGGVAAELRALLSPLGRELTTLRSPASMAPGMSTRPPLPSSAPRAPMPSAPDDGVTADERFDQMRRRLASVQDFLAALASVGELESAGAVGPSGHRGDHARRGARARDAPRTERRRGRHRRLGRGDRARRAARGDGARPRDRLAGHRRHPARLARPRHGHAAVVDAGDARHRRRRRPGAPRLGASRLPRSRARIPAPLAARPRCRCTSRRRSPTRAARSSSWATRPSRTGSAVGSASR